MATIVKTGWLKDKNGDRFAPKTLTSQVQTSDGVTLDDKIEIWMRDERCSSLSFLFKGGFL